MGFSNADITDNQSGALLGQGVFDPSVSLDDNPYNVKRMFDKEKLEISTICAHAHLLEPSSPATYSTAEVMKAIKMASELNIKYVITTEFSPWADWAKKLTYEQSVFIITEKLYEPLRLAEDTGVELLLEPHGPLTDSVKGMKDIMASLGNSRNLGICLDTGNSWLGGADPVEMARVFKNKIKHVHWKDLPKEMEKDRGKKFGCGFSTIGLGEGVIDVASVYEVLKDAGVEHSTLEIAGEENLKNSYAFLKSLGAA
jgi:inosose dehydratase